MSKHTRIADLPHETWSSKVTPTDYATWTVMQDGEGNEKITYEEGVYSLPEGMVEIYMQGNSQPPIPGSPSSTQAAGSSAPGTTASPNPPPSVWLASSWRRSSARRNTAHEHH